MFCFTMACCQYNLQNASQNILFLERLTITLQNNDDLLTDSFPNINITLHRRRVFKELMKAYSNLGKYGGRPKITVILPNEETESAEDTGGVLRDVLSEFWEDFY